MKHPLALLLGMTLVATPCLAAKGIELTNQEEKINYSVGYQIGNDFKNQGVALKSEALVKGIEDALAAEKPLMNEEEMRTTLVDLKKKIVDEQVAKNKEINAKLKEEGGAFLAANAKKEGVVVLPSGLQYKVIKAGDGQKPTVNDTVTVNYIGTRVDGKEFSNTYRAGKPDTIELAKVIPGWQEALPLMQEGAKWELYIPYNLAFGELGPLEGNTVIFEVELLKIEPKK